MVKSQKGYSLVEIGVGILILTVFLICSIALFNGCYNTYRMIQQRNIAVNYAVSAMEDLLQTDADILTGYFTEMVDPSTNRIELVANEEYSQFVSNHFNDEYRERYNRLYNAEILEGQTLSTEEHEKYIYDDKVYLIGEYIKDVVENLSEEEYNSEAVQNGEYALFNPSVIYEGTQVQLETGESADDYDSFFKVIENGDQVIIPNENNMLVKKTVTRLPINDNREAFGNQVLKIKVEVFFTNRINNAGATEKDLKSVKLESIKVANNS